jgi:hypothetical protein
MLSAASVLLENFSATGAASSSTYLRGDNTWATVPAGFNINTVTDQALFTTSSVTFANLTITNIATIAGISLFQDGPVSRIQSTGTLAINSVNSGGVSFIGPYGVQIYKTLAVDTIIGYTNQYSNNTGTNFPSGLSATSGTFNIVKVKNQIELGDSTAVVSRLIMIYNTLTQGISMTNFPGYGGGTNYNGINIGNYTGNGDNTTILGNQGLQARNVSDSIAIGYRAGKGLANNSQNNNTIIGNIITDNVTGQSSISMTNTLLIAAGPDGVDNQRLRIGTDRIILGKNAFTATIAANSIILNASNSTLTTPNSGLFVDPITNNASTQILFYNTSTKEITYSNTSTTQVGYAANILGLGSGNGALLVQDGPNTTGFMGQGSAGWLLVSGGSGNRPAFTNTASIYVGNAANANNLRDGSDYAIPYQRVSFGTATTNYISSSTTASTYLSWTGSGYAWTTPATFDVSTITNQKLFTTSSVVFASVSATTGTFATLTITNIATVATLAATTATFTNPITLTRYQNTLQYDEIGGIYFVGQTDTGGRPLSAKIQAFATVDFTGTNVGSILAFSLADGIERLVVNGSGVQINDAYILPGTDGTAGQVMYTSGAGTLGFKDPNPFNQALFTTSSVTFAAVTATTATIRNLDFGISTDPQG